MFDMHGGNSLQEIYYEQKLREVFILAADNREQIIYDEGQWNYMIALILRNRLASMRDTDRLETVRPSFPLVFSTFLQTINQHFGDGALKNLSSNFDEAAEQLENCRTLINMMNIKFLKHEELESLTKILYTSHEQSLEAQKAMEDIFGSVKGCSEDVFGFIWDKISGTEYKHFKLPHELMRTEKSGLEREFNNRRVRNVHYRKQPVKVIKEYSTGMVKVLAYCADKDTPVECYRVPRVFPHFKELTQFFNQIGATKELLLSKYTTSYLGFDDLTDPEYNQYFFEIKKGLSIQKLLHQHGRTLVNFEPLLKFWAKELLYAFRDITYRSTYTLQKPITLKNVYVSEIGIKVYLKKIKFSEQRDDNLDYHLHFESQMLKMYAMLLMQLLTNRDYQASAFSEAHVIKQIEKEMAGLDISPELKCILYECLHAQDRTLKREEERYHFEINKQISKDKHFEAGGTEAEFEEREQFKELMDKAKMEEEANAVGVRRIQRKPNNPRANARDYSKENERMGVKTEVDLLLEGVSKAEAKMKFDKELHGYSTQGGAGAQAETDKPGKKGKGKSQLKELKFLTVQGLLDHPYFIQINEADISSVIDEFEKLQSPAFDD